jgi:hypothetical protein
VVQYNSLVGLHNYIAESWSNVDTELKRRYDLIPNLVATVKGYAAHERAVLERVVELRNRCAANNGPVGDQARDEGQLVEAHKSEVFPGERVCQIGGVFPALSPVVYYAGAFRVAIAGL